jgi:hypothetical protein
MADNDGIVDLSADKLAASRTRKLRHRRRMNEPA